MTPIDEKQEVPVSSSTWTGSTEVNHQSKRGNASSLCAEAFYTTNVSKCNNTSTVQYVYFVTYQQHHVEENKNHWCNEDNHHRFSSVQRKLVALNSAGNCPVKAGSESSDLNASGSSVLLKGLCLLSLSLCKQIFKRPWGCPASVTLSLTVRLSGEDDPQLLICDPRFEQPHKHTRTLKYTPIAVLLGLAAHLDSQRLFFLPVLTNIINKTLLHNHEPFESRFWTLRFTIHTHLDKNHIGRVADFTLHSFTLSSGGRGLTVSNQCQIWMLIES